MSGVIGIVEFHHAMSSSPGRGGIPNDHLREGVAGRDAFQPFRIAFAINDVVNSNEPSVAALDGDRIAEKKLQKKYIFPARSLV